MNRLFASTFAVAALGTICLSPAGAFSPADNQPNEVVSSLGQARELLEVAKYAEAETALRRAQQQAAPSSAEHAATLDLLGVLQTALGNYEQADEYLRQAASVYKQLPDRSAEYADVLTHRAKALQLHADYAAAEPLLNETFAALAQAKLNGSRHHAQGLAVLADLRWEQGKQEEARNHYARAIEIFQAEKREHSAECIRAQSNLGLLYRALDQAKADKLIRSALADRKALFGERHPDYAHSLNSLALLLQSQGRSSEIDPLLKQALEIRKATLGEKHPDYASTLNALASFYRSQGHYLRAEPAARRAAEICEQALGPWHPYYAAALNNLALVYRDEANYVDAEPLFVKALSIYDGALARSHPYRLTVCQNLAELYEAEGDHLRAKRLLDEQSEARRNSASKDPRGYALWLAAMARVERGQRQWEAAKSLLEQASEALAGARGAELDLAGVLEELAKLNLAQKDYRAADAQLRKVLAIRGRSLGRQHPDFATALENQASLALAQGDFTTAERGYQTVLELREKALGRRHPAYATALANHAGARRALSEHAAAAAEFQQALKIVRQHLNATAVSQSEQQQLAMMHRARLYLDEYLSLMVRMAAPRDQLYAEALAWKGAVSRRQQIMRQMRRALEQEDPKLAALCQQLEIAARQLAQRSHAEPRAGEAAAHARELERLSAQVERLERELASDSADFRRDIESRSRGPEDIRRALPENVALVDLLEYWDIPAFDDPQQPVNAARRLIAFVVRRGRPTELIELGPAAAVEQAVNAWLEGLQQPSEDDPGMRLRTLLWAPLVSLVSDVETVLISPDGAAAWLPWAALPAEEPGKFLIESQAFVMLPTPQMLPDMLAADATASDTPPSLLTVGDIDYGAKPGKPEANSPKRSAIRGDELRYGWRKLAGSRSEILQVDDTFIEAFPDAREPTRLRGQKPTEEAVRAAAPQHRFVHFATHGFFAPPQVADAAGAVDLAPGAWAARSEVAGFHPGLLSGIVLAGANQVAELDADDGILTALEIEQLALGGVQLVTLSACQTGIGTTARGEGLLGLQRAFQVAGASSVLASLWSVDDRPTAQLMAAYYENLWLKKLSRAEALRQAQIDMLNDVGQRGMEFRTKLRGDKKRTPPRYWAAFVLSGDWR